MDYLTTQWQLIQIDAWEVVILLMNYIIECVF